MRNGVGRRRKGMFGFFLVLVALISFAYWMGSSGSFAPGRGEAKISAGMAVPDQEAADLNAHHPEVQAAIGVQNRHTPNLMGIEGVLGMATGVSEQGRPAILFLAEKEIRPGMVPDHLGGIPVFVQLTGGAMDYKSGADA